LPRKSAKNAKDFFIFALFVFFCGQSIYKMNRLQKKCVIATAGFHLLLLVILFVGPAFFNSKPKPDDSQVLDVIPANLIDAALNSGVRAAQPPPPAPTPIVTPPQPQPVPPAPKPVVQPAPAPPPTFIRSLENLFAPEPKPEPAKPAPVATPNPPHKIQVDLHPVVRNPSNNSTTAKPKVNSPLARNLAAELKSKLSAATQIDVPGDSSAAYANYASVVKSIYDAAWILPGTIAKDENITVSVTIASDGTVISSSIVTPSGDAPADASVQSALDRVKFVRAFPDGATDKERTYTIVFNPQIKNSE
jgi:TonB family protein